MHKVVDLRSDAVTLPTHEMREVMKLAEVGDDDFGEDPTMNCLEKMAAELLGKENGLFIPSGTMGNLIAILIYTKERENVITGAHAHIHDHEYPGILRFAKINFFSIEEGESGIESRDFKALIESNSSTKFDLITLENSHNRSGGRVMPLEQMDEIAEIARRHNIPVHLDGARIFNAAVSLKVKLRDMAKNMDSVMFCLTKCLGAPGGSILVGTAKFIEKARKIRWMLGGGMKQMGILAAAGIVGLKTMVNRIEEDHKNAKMLAKGLSKIKALDIDPHKVQTNMVVLDIAKLRIKPEEFVTRLEAHRVKAVPFGGNRVRMVTHKDIDCEGIEYTIKATREVVNKECPTVGL